MIKVITEDQDTVNMGYEKKYLKAKKIKCNYYGN